VLLLGAAPSAQAADCSDYPGGIIDGFAGTIAPSQLQIDRDCTIRNYPASNALRTNFSFLTQPGQTNDRWLVVFDNVVHTGQMSCNTVSGHKIWFTNGSSTQIQDGCQNLLIPVEKIDKQIPAGPATAAIGVPFTYTLTMPVLFDSGTGTVINTSGSLNDLHGITLRDDLNATGADLTYVSHVAYWEGSGAPVTHSFSNVGGLLSFSGFPVVPAGEQIIVELTVVLDDTPANAPGTQFVNTAKWDFGRLIDGVFYEPLPGEWGISPPLTIAAPDVQVTKTGPTTLGLTLNLGEWGQFGIDALNTGLSDAWNVTLLDRLPNGASGGMCDVTPEVLSAQVFAADGVTPVPGKGPLILGTDFSLSYAGVPTCELSLTMLTAAAAIGPNERLVLTYRTQLDADSQDGAALTNVVGATQWFNGAPANVDRLTFTRTLTDGTVGVTDHQDAHTVNVALFGYFFEKSVENFTSGTSPTTTAAPGDTLRYTLRLQATDVALNGISFSDDLGAMNATPVFVPGSLTLVPGSIPPGADTSNTNPNGGTNGAGLLDVRNLNVPIGSQVSIQFDVTVDGALADGTVLTNQADLVGVGAVKLADSDDPNVNGQADPSVPGDEDPTRVVVATLPVGPLTKDITQPSAAVGEVFRYRITVPETPYPYPIYDVRITDDLTASAADLRFVGVSRISGTGAWTPVNTGTPTSPVIEDTAVGIDIPAGEQIVIELSVVLEDTVSNVTGLAFTNTASFVYNWEDGKAATLLAGSPGTSPPMTILGSDTLIMTKSGPARMVIGTPETFTLDVHNTSTGPAWSLRIDDQLPNLANGGTCDRAPTILTARIFQSDGVTPVSAPLVAGTDFITNFVGAPSCFFTVTMQTPVTVVGADERLIFTYETELDTGSQDAVPLTNVAGATQWFSASGQDRREYAHVLTDGTVGVLDHEDAVTVMSGTPQYRFEKTVLNVTTGANPAVTASPGDTLRYRLEIENVGTVPLSGFSLVDELDRLNPTPLFQPGTLQIVTMPAGADDSGTNGAGGASATGVLDVGNLSLLNLGDLLVIEFEATLASVIANGVSATNQSELQVGGVSFASSDDPNVNGPADPLIAGDEDPTRVVIASTPDFLVQKTSIDLDGDPAVLLSGERLQYTITVKNVGTDHAVDATLRDAVPVNTQYVAGSTTLNGALVADAAGGVSPLSAGILIYAPENPTPGAMRADPDPVANNVATIIFQVIVDAGAIDGTIISNQGFVSAVTGGVVDQPSDDPSTATIDDPTRNVVGALPLLFAAKDVVIQTDGGTAGVVDPGDVLRYTITLSNNGTVPATAVSLMDAVPANTTYVADTVTLNGLPVGQPDGGSSPLVGGIDVSSADLTPPLPAAGLGTVSPGQAAVIEFDLQVNAGTAPGTLISNQAQVASAELPILLTDGDGNPATGPEPTVVVVGAGQQLAVTKTVAVVGGGAALAGSQLEYIVQVTNIATVPASDVVITDDLDAPVAGQLAYVPASATLNGSAAGVSVVGSVITADYSTLNGMLAPGQSVVLRFQATLDPGLAMGTTVTNTGMVTWNAATQNASASVSLDVGGQPGVGAVGGTLWHDSDFDLAAGASERLLDGWTVELTRNGQVVASVLSDASGVYRFSGLEPNVATADQYALRFAAPGASATTASLGRADSPYTDGPQTIADILVASGGNLLNLNLPIQPSGVVYDAIQRTPIAGVRVSLVDPATGTPLPASCFDDAAQGGQVTLAGGYYKFDLNFSSGACPSGGRYLIDVIGAGAGYADGYSGIIPPQSDATTAAFSVPTCPGSPNDAVPATAEHCEVQVSAASPPAVIAAQDPATRFHSHFVFDGTLPPGTSQIFNNHLAMDPTSTDIVAITKTTPSTNVILGQLVPYEITIRNQGSADLAGLDIVDRFPAGFRYVEGSAKLDGRPAEPTVNLRELTWSGVDVAASATSKLVLLLAVGAGVSEGEFINRAYVSGPSGILLSGEAFATVRVIPDPDFACTDVMGKVFDDLDRDGEQTRGEAGLEGVRLVTPRGLVATTDEHGRFHITCAIVPHPERGSNMVLKLDDRSLPSGYRLSSRQTQVKRATRGKALRFTYGASVHRVVGLDLADAVFEPGSTEVREQWKERLGLLLDELEKSEATLRLSYVADVEEAKLVDRRLAAVKKTIESTWKERGDYPLTVETEIYWRRGAPASGPMTLIPDIGGWLGSLRPELGAPSVVEVDAGNASERILPSDEPLTRWTQDAAHLDSDSSDRLEEREVVKQVSETVKLKDVVPPIRFGSGESQISSAYIQNLRNVLAGMKHLHNVRLHLVGHSDDQPLSLGLANTYGDNAGLSRERAGEAAEFVQEALDLPPEAISFAWAGESEPVASNANEVGRAQNRRVEVEVWYDELGQALELEEVVVSEDVKRVKVCRTETVCKMRFLDGHERRARVKNLVPPLQIDLENARVSKPFIRQVAQALDDLSGKHNVTVKLVGFTDNAPLTGRTARIYGTHLALSKATARRASLAVKEALGLSSSAVASDGRGAERPVASNETPRGRALNRRVEVEFWYDDPLQELPDEPQICPDAAGEGLVSRVYDPPWGSIQTLRIEDGEPILPDGYDEKLHRAMTDVSNERNVRLRFVGYTGNARLDRRTALAYGDDIGLSAARARRTMEAFQTRMGLSESQVEHEGRGYVHSKDVVNGGFIQGETSHVEVQVVYDESALLDDYEGIEITPISHELRPKDPLALNLMHITVDGKPIDDPGRSSADIQRCTDVALERADMEFRFDDLNTRPRLSVTSDVGAVGVSTSGDAATGAASSSVRFKMYSNYGHFIERAEVRVFEREQSLEAEPLAVLPIGSNGVAEWTPDSRRFSGPVRKLKFILRAYGDEERFDETSPQVLWLVHGVAQPGSEPESGAPTTGGAPLAAAEGDSNELLAGYGENELGTRNIDLGSVGTVRVQGEGVPPDHTVWLAGNPVPVDESGRFVAEAVLPSGMHTVEVSVLDEAGNGELFLRDVELEESDWFYVAMADVTVAGTRSSFGSDRLQGANAPTDPDSLVDGRFAFYVNGKFGNDWKLTASADTREGAIDDIFKNFFDKSPTALFRRMDPDYFYPTFGDDGTVEQMAPTMGKFYAKLSQNDNHALWGNFKVSYHDNELALVERGLYGGNLHFQTDATTGFGERRLTLDGFAADPGTVASREDFRGTGGSLYYLRHRDVLMGSDRLRIEVRDKDTGIVMAVAPLNLDEDYDIDYIQGRVLLNEPVASIVDDHLLVRTGGLSGNEAWLVAQYEYAPGFADLDSLAAGGEGQLWLNDYFKVGATAYHNEEGGGDNSLYAGNLIARWTAETWAKGQVGWSDGLGLDSHRSDDGGFSFQKESNPVIGQGAFGYRADASLGFGDVLKGAPGKMTAYYQRLEAGYSASGLNAENDTDQYGGTLEVPVTEDLEISAKLDWTVEAMGLATNAQEVDVSYDVTDHWSLAAGVRNDEREDNSPAPPATQAEGGRTDGVLEAAFDSQGSWRMYGFGQATMRRTGNRRDNNRGGVGGSYRVNDRLVVDGEVSYGTDGAAVQIGTDYQESEQTSRYISYALDNERAVDGRHARRGNLVSGARTRLGDSASVYREDRFEHNDESRGISRAVGIEWAPTDRWSIGGNWETGTLIDRLTQAETKRNAGGGRFSYRFDRFQLSTGIEYRSDETEQPGGLWSDRTTWLFRNDFRLQLTPDWRLLGKLNHSFSNSSLGEFFDGGYTEAVLGYAYRPIWNDRLNVLAKYTYFYNMPATDQVGSQGVAAQFLQRSHIASLDVSYDLTRNWTLGGKYAYRRGEVSLDRENPEYFDNDAHLLIGRVDWRFLKNWETSVEGRTLYMPDLDDQRSGAVITIYRYLGEHFKVGVGYNFTGYSDDLTDLSYDRHGLFFNLIGTL
jgi:uncharacterized repeat protein (TIGR01451 family)